jgi:hypothetical protein
MTTATQRTDPRADALRAAARRYEAARRRADNEHHEAIQAAIHEWKTALERIGDTTHNVEDLTHHTEGDTTNHG